MKKIITSLMLCTVVSVACAQETDSIKINRTLELQKMGKINLSRVYMDLIEGLFVSAPNAPFINSLENVPSNGSIKRDWKAINRAGYRNMKAIRKHYRYLLPYSDKADLIRSILFLEKVQLELNNIK